MISKFLGLVFRRAYANIGRNALYGVLEGESGAQRRKKYILGNTNLRPDFCLGKSWIYEDHDYYSLTLRQEVSECS
jgi:hypothetical protein